MPRPAFVPRFLVEKNENFRIYKILYVRYKSGQAQTNIKHIDAHIMVYSGFISFY